MKYNFALIGAAGYIAPRHMQAIRDTGNALLAAVDPHDSVGILDSYFTDTEYFSEFERFDRYIEKKRQEGGGSAIHYISICSPNHLHDAHIRFALRSGAHALCEKPLVLNPWNIDALQKLQDETEKKIYSVLQLRLHPQLIKLKTELEAKASSSKSEVTLTYITTRGAWYQNTWKSDVEKSGGLATNIGIHFFDLLIWLFGSVESFRLHVTKNKTVAGTLELERARVKWFLSIDSRYLPHSALQKASRTYRSIEIDNASLEFSEGFTNLHTETYKHILSGKGFGLQDVRPSIQLAHDLRIATTSTPDANAHPLVTT